MKVLFRFSVVYFLLYIIGIQFSSLWNPVVDWLAAHVLHLDSPVTIKPNGSGDTTYNYVQVFGILLLALLGTGIWSVLDHKRPHYDKLLYWLLVLVRYTLAAAMIRYGFAKIFKTQFPFTPPYGLLQPLGDSSPMGLVWKFMGYSTGYNYFTGIAEALAGVFLFFRRTATFGALLSLTVLANIVALNFFFDVPVKLYSTHLLLMAFVIAAPDLKRIYTFFFLRKPVQSLSIDPFYEKKWMKHTHFWVKLIFIAFLGYTTVVNGYLLQKRYGDQAPKHPLYGAYVVETFIRNGDTLAPLTTDTTRWKALAVNHEKFLTAQLMNDSLWHLQVKFDSTLHTFSWWAEKDTMKNTLQYVQQNKDYVVLTGRIEQDSVKMHLRKLDLQQFRLLSRGFHWVNEYPYNR
ncbi:hypothetical protein [Sabulibacter ruber]|uniref:hypothetical protein n=1 Tax=Sabulibacter ruber TaxID=2811901 RepID=UPI001A95CC2B|nr:hypothetical protein [Sabulibacter ruber]